MSATTQVNPHPQSSREGSEVGEGEKIPSQPSRDNSDHRRFRLFFRRAAITLSA
jgi:hypothetical protein